MVDIQAAAILKIRKSAALGKGNRRRVQRKIRTAPQTASRVAALLPSVRVAAQYRNSRTAHPASELFLQHASVSGVGTEQRSGVLVEFERFEQSVMPRDDGSHIVV